MRNKIPCTAKKLSQLQPEMIQSVVTPQVFQLGREYHTANCVQIIEANDVQILSEVNGPFGLYEQTIQLRGGTLLTKCSCTSNEQPFCRHCVAVLLGYQDPQANGDQPRHSDQAVWEETEPSGEETHSSTSSTLSAKLHEITTFIDWLQPAVKALEHGQPLPAGPTLAPGDVLNWIQALQALDARCRVSEEQRSALQGELHARESRFESLVKQMESLPRRTSDAQTVCESMERAVMACRGMLGKLSEIAQERDRLEDQLKSMTDDMIKKGSELSALVVSLQELSAALPTMTPTQS